MKHMFIKYLWILLMVACTFALAGCGQVPMADRVIDQHKTQQESTEQTDTDSIVNIKNIVDALGGVFAPQSCKK